MPLPPIPIQGRFGVIGYDLNLNLTGDYASIGGITGAANNGFLFFYPSRNVSLDLTVGVWTVEVGIWTGSTYVWAKEYIPLSQGAYYPDVPEDQADLHAWAGTHSMSHSINAGLMTGFGYDGVGVIPGDLQPGSYNGILFTRPIAAPHIISGPGGAVWHGRLNVDAGGGNYVYAWAVYPVDHVLMQEITTEQLNSLTGQ